MDKNLKLQKDLLRDFPKSFKTRLYQAFQKDHPPQSHSMTVTSIKRVINTHRLSSERKLQNEKSTTIRESGKKQVRSSSELGNFTKQQRRSSKSFREPVPQPKKVVIQPSKISKKAVGKVQAYAANTSPGFFKTYNEDRVSLIVNIPKVKSQPSFFSIYDGHGGTSCSDFLKDNLHNLVTKDPAFLTAPEEALASAIIKAQDLFLSHAQKSLDSSGSCCLSALFVQESLYIANVGDSRAILSIGLGSQVRQLTKDHRPIQKEEYSRILKAGGMIYQNKSRLQGEGPHRVMPGGLSVSRTIGDIEAKRTGGHNGVIIPNPQILRLDLQPDHDFLLLGDGVTDIMTNQEIVRIVWQTLLTNKAADQHRQCGLCAQAILSEALKRKAGDNITVVLIGLQNMGRELFDRQGQVNARRRGPAGELLLRE